MTAWGSETGEKDLTSLHTLNQFANPKVRHKERGEWVVCGWVMVGEVVVSGG